jgi:hypothetical protein
MVESSKESVLIDKIMQVVDPKGFMGKEEEIRTFIKDDLILAQFLEKLTEEQLEKLTSVTSNQDFWNLVTQVTGEHKKKAQSGQINQINLSSKFKLTEADHPISTGLWWFVWSWIMLQSGFIITAYRKEKDNQDPPYTRQNRQISKGLYLFAVVSMTTAWVALILRLLRHVPMEKNVVKTSKRMSDVYLLILWNFVLGCWTVNDTRKSPNPGPNKVVLGLGAAAIVVGVLFVLLLRIWPRVAVYVRGY